MLEEYEEYKPIRQFWLWLAVITLSMMTIGWGLLVHVLVPGAPREWDFGTLPDTPGQSVFSTVPPPEVEVVPSQIQLPRGRTAENRKESQGQ